MALPHEVFWMLQLFSKIIGQASSQPIVQNDPLIARSLQKEQYIGIFLISISLILVVGFFSRRVEYALMFATALSIVLIVFFLTV
jgi:hypothetical protein